MEAQRAPRLIEATDAAPGDAARRALYVRALDASRHLREPQGCVALVLVEVQPASASMALSEQVLVAVTTRLAEMLNRRLRSVDVLARSASCELAVLLTRAQIDVAAAFSERLRQPIEQVLRHLNLADDVIVCMGMAANPSHGSWTPELLIELADYRMRTALRGIGQPLERDWALMVDGSAVPPEFPELTAWPATQAISTHSGY